MLLGCGGWTVVSLDDVFFINDAWPRGGVRWCIHHQTPPWNKAQLLFSQDLVDWAATEGLEIVGGGGGLPMAAVKMPKGGGDADVMVRELPPSAKYFRRQGIIRYSDSSLGCKDDSWVDATEAFCRDLEGLIRCREC